MATALHGKDGYVYWNGTAVALVTNWSATIGPAMDDITAMDSSGWQQMTPGIKKASGSVTVRYATDDTIQTSMRNNTIGGTAMVLRLYPNGNANYFSGSAFLTLDLSGAFDSPVEAVYNFESHGAWSYT